MKNIAPRKIILEQRVLEKWSKPCKIKKESGNLENQDKPITPHSKTVPYWNANEPDGQTVDK